MKDNNKIQIPWYKRNVKLRSGEDIEIPSISFNLPNLPKPRGTSRQPNPQRQPEPEKVRSPVRSPVKLPLPNPTLNPNPLDNLFPQDDPFNKEFPLPIPIPPLKNPNDKTVNNPIPQPAINPITEALTTVLQPIIYLFAAKEILNKVVETKITDPIYGKMMQDPVLGYVLREAEKSNLDMQAAATYFANYDYSNFNADTMTKELTVLFGAAAAVRLVVFFIGRKVVFKI